jgi:hypothetical protein
MKASQQSPFMKDKNLKPYSEVLMCQFISAPLMPKKISMYHMINLTTHDAETQPDLPFKDALLDLSTELTVLFLPAAVVPLQP